MITTATPPPTTTRHRKTKTTAKTTTTMPTTTTIFLGCDSIKFQVNLKVGSWEHLEQIPTVAVTFVQATFALATFCPYQEYLSCY